MYMFVMNKWFKNILLELSFVRRDRCISNIPHEHRRLIRICNTCETLKQFYENFTRLIPERFNSAIMLPIMFVRVSRGCAKSVQRPQFLPEGVKWDPRWATKSFFFLFFPYEINFDVRLKGTEKSSILWIILSMGIYIHVVTHFIRVPGIEIVVIKRKGWCRVVDGCMSTKAFA